MRDTVPQLVVGDLAVVGERFQFSTLDEVFELPPGTAVRIALRWSFEEASSDRERLRLVFTVQLGETLAAGSELSVVDHLLVHDKEEGVLSRPLVVPEFEEKWGRFIVEAQYGRGSWMPGGEEAVTRFRAEGKFLLRPKKPERDDQ